MPDDLSLPDDQVPTPGFDLFGLGDDPDDWIDGPAEAPGFDLPAETVAEIDAHVEAARRHYARTREIRRGFRDVARGRLAMGDDPIVVRSELTTDGVCDLIPGHDVPGSQAARLAEVYLDAIDRGLTGRPLGPLPDLFHPEDFVPPGQDPAYRPLSETLARICIEAGRDGDPSSDADDSP